MFIHKCLLGILVSLTLCSCTFLAMPNPDLVVEDKTGDFQGTSIIKKPIKIQVTDTQAVSKPVTKDQAAMVYVPAGEFTMGSDLLAQERPIHKVYLDAFWIDKYEVSNELYRKCVKAGGCEKGINNDQDSDKDNNFPATLINWEQADKYCKWAGKALPTEAQWEKAARGDDERIYPWGNIFNTKLVNSAYGDLVTVPVDSYPDGASAYGAFNMSGNVWEWVADWYEENYYVKSPYINPKGPDLATGENKVARGGGYGGAEAVLRTSYRRSIYIIEIGRYLGFRCAK